MDNNRVIPVIGTGKYYRLVNKNGVVSGKINVNNDVALEIPYEHGQKMTILYNKETNEICMKPFIDGYSQRDAKITELKKRIKELEEENKKLKGE